MEKFVTNHTKYIKEWRLGDVRITKDLSDRCYATYAVQRFDGKRWSTVNVFHTLNEAKKAARWVADDMAADAARMN